MASPYSTEELYRQHKPLVIPAFPNETNSCTMRALATLWPLSAADFMDIRLQELAQPSDRMNQLNEVTEHTTSPTGEEETIRTEIGK